MHYSLMDLITDIFQNGAESGADLMELFISETVNSSRNEFSFTVKDNGKGMTNEELEQAKDPFFSDGIKHPRRRVGLGIPFLVQTAESTGGRWKIESKKRAESLGITESAGTEVCAWFDLDNVDTPPVGDIAGMLRTVLLFEGPSEVMIKCRGRVNYQVCKTELSNAVGGLKDTRSLVLMSEYLKEIGVR